jgi:hypothetical protein
MPAKVYDFRSRRPLQTHQNVVENEKEVEGGRYIGNIGKNNAKAFQTTLAVLEGVLERYAEIQDELVEVTNLHVSNMDYVLSMLRYKEQFNEEFDELMVDEKGNVWVVPFQIEEDEDE